MPLFVFKLSNELRSLSRAEFRALIEAEALGRRYEFVGELAIADLGNDESARIAERMALLRSWGRILECVEIKKPSELITLVKKLQSEGFCVAIDCIRGFGKEVVEKALREGMKMRRCRDGERVAEVVLSEGLALAYEMKRVKRSYRFGSREPHKRPVYLPGTMKAWLARVFVNLARVRRGNTLFDPFCGVGGFALEACSMGIKCICADIDERMVRGARRNVAYYGCDDMVDICLCDAAQTPVANVDGIATDPPYGRMSTPRGYELNQLLMKFVEECVDVVHNHGYIVFAVPEAIDSAIYSIINKKGLKVVERLLNWVHGGLVRVLYVIQR